MTDVPSDHITDQHIADAAAMEAAGIDLAELQVRRETGGLLLLDVMTAARAVSQGIGKRGSEQRRIQLGDALDALTAHDPTSAVLVAAAVWSDRYGSAGAPARLADLQDAVEALSTPTIGTVVESNPVSECAGGCSCQTPSAEELAARDADRIAAGPSRTAGVPPNLLG